jgi:diaminopropionate ammonia-lyase
MPEDRGPTLAARPVAAPAWYAPGRPGRPAVPRALARHMPEDACDAAVAEIRSWPGYAPTPLLSLRARAAELGIADVLFKDEGRRLPLKSFKQLGGSYAVAHELAAAVAAEAGVVPTARELADGRWAGITSGITVTCATDGNHGRAVAWAARTFGCRAVVYVHGTVSEGRCAAIRDWGAEVVRVPGVYEDAVAAAAARGADGWIVVSDTAYPGCERIPALVMRGYAAMAAEIAEQAGAPPTHVVLQCGVGGMASAVGGWLARRWAESRPRFLVCEPERADCAFRSALAGEMRPASGDLDTVCAGLACGVLSTHAWEILHDLGDGFAVFADDEAIEEMRRLAEPLPGDPAIVGGECAGAGMAALARIARDPHARAAAGLGPGSRVVVVGTEGDTDPELRRALMEEGR